MAKNSVDLIYCLAAEDGPGVIPEHCGQEVFTAVAVFVADCVKASGVGHLAEVGKFVTDDIVAQFLSEEKADVAQVYVAGGGAFAESLEPVHDSP